MAGNGKISVAAATAVGLGAIIGAGIFVLSGTVIALAGTFALPAFVLVGAVALMMAFVFGEVGSILPGFKGASYSYAYSAFGSEIGFITGILLYMSYATAASVMSLGFGTYLASLLGMNYGLNPIIFASLLIVALALINVLGIKKAASVDLVLVIIKIAILVAFVAFALFIAYKTGSAGNLTAPGTGTAGSVFNAIIAIFFAYTGFQTITTFFGSVKGGSRSAAKAILYSVSISMVIYLLVIISMMLLLPASKYTISADPLALALQSVNAPKVLLYLVDFGALIATASAALAMILSSSRIAYQMSADRLLPRALRRFDAKKDVAVNGVILSAAIGIATLFAGNIFTIASISNFGLIFSYIIACLVLIHFRKAGRRGEFKAPLYPYIPVITVIALIIFIIGIPREALLFGVMLIFSMIAAYYLLREIKEKKVIRVRLFD